jgi:hypothetical protein
VVVLPQEEVTLQAAQGHAFNAVEIVESVLRGLGDGAQKRLAGILAQPAQQLPQGKPGDLAALAFQVLHIESDLRRSVASSARSSIPRAMAAI